MSESRRPSNRRLTTVRAARVTSVRPSDKTARSAFVILAALALLATGAPGTQAATNDPLVSRQWGIQKIGAPQAWAAADGSGTLIAVVDTGVDFAHPDLDGKLVYFSDADMVEPDGTCKGSWKRGTRTCDQDGAQDANGHGTHVAGIAAAETGNGVGAAGTAPGARILPVRVLDANGAGSTDEVAAGIRYAADKGADVINLSLGFLSGVGEVANLVGVLDPVHEAIAYAIASGSVVVVAAGNDSFPLCAEPAAASGVLCVGATDRNDLRSWYSNGDATMSKNYLVAPGGAGSFSCEDDADIWSTVPAGGSYDCTGQASLSGREFHTGYDTLAGTSMAAPFVAGVAALVRSAGVTSVTDIVSCIVANADDLGTPGHDPIFGHGRLNAERAVAVAVAGGCA